MWISIIIAMINWITWLVKDSVIISWNNVFWFAVGEFLMYFFIVVYFGNKFWGVK